MTGGELDKSMLKEAFSKIKEDITRLNSELNSLKAGYETVARDNSDLKGKISNSGQEINKDMIKQIVEETINSLNKNQNKTKFVDNMVKKINMGRKVMIKNRITSLAEQKNLSVSEIREILVEQENICSKATFYRYIRFLKNKGIIDFIDINGNEIVVKTHSSSL